MNNIQKSKLNFLVSLLYQISAIALGLIIPRITLLAYGSSTNGLLSSALQFVGYLALLEAGIQAVAAKSLYETIGNNDNEGTNAILAAVNINYKKIGVYYLVGLVALSAVYPLLIREETLGYFTVLLVVFFSGFSNVILFFFQGKYRILLQVDGKNYFISLMNIITNVVNHVLKIILMYLRVNIVFVVIGSFLASLISAVMIMAYVKKRYKWIDMNVEPNFSALAQNKEAIIHQVSWMIFSSVDTLLLTIFCDLKIVSIYAIYKLINDYIYTFAQIPFQSISFRLGQLFHKDIERFKKYINCTELFTGNCCFILFTVTLCLTTSFVGLYTDNVNDVNYADQNLSILFISVQLLSCMRVPMLNTIGYAGHYRQTIAPTLIETALNLVISIAGVIFMGIYGVLLGTIVSLVYRTIDIIVYSNKKLLDRSPTRTFLYYAVEGILLVGIYTLFVNLNIEVDSYFKFFVVGAVLTMGVGVSFFVISCILFREEYATLKSIVLNRG